MRERGLPEIRWARQRAQCPTPRCLFSSVPTGSSYATRLGLVVPRHHFRRSIAGERLIEPPAIGVLVCRVAGLDRDDLVERIQLPGIVLERSQIVFEPGVDWQNSSGASSLPGERVLGIRSTSRPLRAAATVFQPNDRWQWERSVLSIEDLGMIVNTNQNGVHDKKEVLEKTTTTNATSKQGLSQRICKRSMGQWL